MHHKSKNLNLSAKTIFQYANAISKSEKYKRTERMEWERKKGFKIGLLHKKSMHTKSIFRLQVKIEFEIKIS